MSDESNGINKDKTKKEVSPSKLMINNSTDSVIDEFEEDDISTPRNFTSQSPGPKSGLQLGNLLISSASGLNTLPLNSPGGGAQHPEAKSLSSSGVIIPTFITRSNEKTAEATGKVEGGGAEKAKPVTKKITEIKLGMDTDDDDEEETNKAQEKPHSKESLEDVEVEVEKKTEDEKETKKAKEEGKEETEKEDKNEEDREKKDDSRWETRIADYFAVIGTDVKEVIPESDPEDTTKSYTAKVLDRIPMIDYEDTQLPGGLDIFCFPNGIKGTPLNENAGPVSSIFTLTSEDGTRLYAISLRIYEKVFTQKEENGEKEEEKKEEKEKEKEKEGGEGEKENNEKPKEWYIPYCLCIISHRPFFSLYKAFLFSVYDKLRNSEANNLSEVGDYIAEFMFNTPVPTPGSLSLEYGDNKKLKLPFAEDFPYVDVNKQNRPDSFHIHYFESTYSFH